MKKVVDQRAFSYHQEWIGFLLNDLDGSQPNHLETMTNIPHKHMITPKLLSEHANIIRENTINPQPMKNDPCMLQKTSQFRNR
jgi:hypothetical protein